MFKSDIQQCLPFKYTHLYLVLYYVIFLIHIFILNLNYIFIITYSNNKNKILLLVIFKSDTHIYILVLDAYVCIPNFIYIMLSLYYTY